VSTPPNPDRLERCGTQAQQALDMLFDLAGDPEGFEPWWRDEWDAYDSSVRAVADGRVTIEEVPELDLAIVRVDTGHGQTGPMAWESAPLHRAAVHSATSCLRVVTLAGPWMTFHFRYESWVRLEGHRPRPRVDLERLAHVLTAAEGGSTGGWVFDGAGSITGELHRVDAEAPSTIEPERFLQLIRAELATLDRGPAAWDPYVPP
jgi:hypothetical protein